MSKQPFVLLSAILNGMIKSKFSAATVCLGIPQALRLEIYLARKDNRQLLERELTHDPEPSTG